MIHFFAPRFVISRLNRDSKIPTYARMWTAMNNAKPTVFTKSNEEGVDRVSKVWNKVFLAPLINMAFNGYFLYLKQE